MTDISSPDGNSQVPENVVIPVELMGKIPLPLGLPSSYRVVSSAVEQFNQATGSNIDPISVAEALVKKGYMINFIPERKVEVRPTEEGLILDKKQILQVLSDDRLAEFPILDMAIDVVAFASFGTAGNLRNVMEHIGSVPRWSFSRDKEEAKDPRVIAEEFLLDQAMLQLRYGDKAASHEEGEKIAPYVVQQVIFILENIESVDQLRTSEQKLRHQNRHKIAEEADRRARQSRREELLASLEAAERWLYGVARGAYRDAKNNVEDAARELAKSKRAPELIAHHAIDLFDFTDRQIASAVERDRNRRDEIAWVEGPIAVLLAAFGNPRVIDGSPQAIRKDPGDYIYRLVSLWLDAKFVAELPSGAYAEALHNERQYQERQRSRNSDEWRRESSFYGFRGEERDGFYDGIAREEKARGDREMQGYETSRVATLWWKCPQWLQWKILRRYIGDELRRVADFVRGYNAKQFLAYIDGLIAKENRVIELQRLVLGTTQTPADKETRDRYWKEIMETGAPSILALLTGRTQEPKTPTQERAEAIIQASRDRIKDLTEMRDQVNLDFVMSREQRDAEIDRRQRERARWQIPRFSFRL